MGTGTLRDRPSSLKGRYAIADATPTAPLTPEPLRPLRAGTTARHSLPRLPPDPINPDSPRAGRQTIPNGPLRHRPPNGHREAKIPSGCDCKRRRGSAGSVWEARRRTARGTRDVAVADRLTVHLVVGRSASRDAQPRRPTYRNHPPTFAPFTLYIPRSGAILDSRRPFWGVWSPRSPGWPRQRVGAPGGGDWRRRKWECGGGGRAAVWEGRRPAGRDAGAEWLPAGWDAGRRGKGRRGDHGAGEARVPGEGGPQLLMAYRKSSCKLLIDR